MYYVYRVVRLKFEMMQSIIACDWLILIRDNKIVRAKKRSELISVAARSKMCTCLFHDLQSVLSGLLLNSPVTANYYPLLWVIPTQSMKGFMSCLLAYR